MHVNYSKTCRFPLTQTHLLKPLSLIFRNLNPRCSHSGWEWHGLAEAEGAVCVREVLRKGFELCRLIRKASYTSKKRQKLLKRLRPKCWALKFDDTGIVPSSWPCAQCCISNVKIGQDIKICRGCPKWMAIRPFSYLLLGFPRFLVFFSNPSGFCLWFLCCTAKVRRAEAFMSWRLDSCQWAGAVRSTTMNYATWDFEIPIWDRMANVKILEKRSRYWLLFHFSIFFFLLVTNGY